MQRIRAAMPLVCACCAAVLAVAACAVPEKTPIVLTPKSEVGAAPVVRQEVPAAKSQAASAAEPARLAPVPPGTLYVCVSEKAGAVQQTVISFVPKVEELCRKHPEMGPCQYERNVCRGSGGRVYTATGNEITMATEAEYDRKVMRVRFKAN